MRKLDDWIDSYLDCTSNSEPRESYRRWAAISTIAAALQRKCYLDWGTETFYPNFYIVLIGPPAARKGTAMKPVMEFLDELGIRRTPDMTSRQKIISRMEEAYENVADSEGRLFPHSSLTIFSRELTVFLGYGERELLDNLNDWYDCHPRFQYDTHKHGLQEVNNVWINLFGATTPVNLQLSLPDAAVGSGFTSRTIFVYEENKERIVIFPGLTDRQKEVKKQLLQDLGDIYIMSGKFKYVENFIEIYGRWYEQSERHPPFSEPRLEYYLQRRHVHLLKLCMIHSASRGGSMIITVDDFNRSRKTLEEVEKKMPEVFRGTGASPLSFILSRVMKVVAQKDVIGLDELMNMFHEEVTSSQMGEVIATMQDMNFAQMDPIKRILRYIKKED